MSHKISLSLSDWVFETYVPSNIRNRSKFIEEMLVKGCEVESGDFSSTKQKILHLMKENQNLRNDVETWKKTAELWKNKKSKRKMTDNEKMAQAILDKGLYND
jgi:hypothetical protein